ncbi:MAG: hypothetical protein OER82_11575, partial [Nitrosopumilus sp.]|nr:hypothetical protein [Nitrosopumilus sp.]
MSDSVKLSVFSKKAVYGFLIIFMFLITAESSYGFEVVSPPDGSTLSSDTLDLVWDWNQLCSGDIAINQIWVSAPDSIPFEPFKYMFFIGYEEFLGTVVWTGEDAFGNKYDKNDFVSWADTPNNSFRVNNIATDGSTVNVTILYYYDNDETEDCGGDELDTLFGVFIASKIYEYTAFGGELDSDPTLSVTVNPPVVEYGGSTTLSWDATGVERCSIPGDRTMKINGSIQKENLIEVTQFTVRCFDDSGQEVISRSAFVGVLGEGDIEITRFNLYDNPPNGNRLSLSNL